MIHFEWDSEKAARNEEKHGISFHEACSVFFDESAILFDDPAHSDREEKRYVKGI